MAAPYYEWLMAKDHGDMVTDHRTRTQANTQLQAHMYTQTLAHIKDTKHPRPHPHPHPQAPALAHTNLHTHPQAFTLAHTHPHP